MEQEELEVKTIPLPHHKEIMTGELETDTVDITTVVAEVDTIIIMEVQAVVVAIKDIAVEVILREMTAEEEVLGVSKGEEDQAHEIKWKGQGADQESGF